MPTLPSKEEADISPGILEYQCTSKFQLVPPGNSATIYMRMTMTMTCEASESLYNKRKSDSIHLARRSIPTHCTVIFGACK